MRTNEKISIASGIFGIIFIALTITMLSRLQLFLSKELSDDVLISDRMKSAISSIDKARSACINYLPVDPVSLNNPFVDQSDMETNRSTSDYSDFTSANNRPVLILRGQLIKDRPLAILEDGKGSTIIVGIGEIVLGCTLTSISAKSVSLRDNSGTFAIYALP